MNNPYSHFGTSEERAKSLLLHYFQLCFGQELSSDSQSEVGEIIDCILQTVEERTLEYRLKQLEKKAAGWQRLYKQQSDLLQECQAAIEATLNNEMQSAGALGIGSGKLLKDVSEKLEEHFAE